jgi:hypothetical protein
MKDSLALQTKQKMAKVYLGGIVVFSLMITTLVVLIRLVTLNGS